MPLRNNYANAYDVWHQNSETFRNNADARRMEIDNQTQHARNIVEMLYKQAATQQQQQQAIGQQAENEANAMPRGPGGQRADIYTQTLELMKREAELEESRTGRKAKELEQYKTNEAIRKERTLIPEAERMKTFETNEAIRKERAVVNYDSMIAVNKTDPSQIRTAKWNNRTGRAEFMDGTPVGDNWVATKSSASGTPGEMAPSKKDMEDFRAAEISTRNSIGEMDRMRKQLGSNKTLTGIMASATMGIDSVVSSFQQFAASYGHDDSALLNPNVYDFSAFGKSAQTAAFRSNATGLAYSIARAQSGTGVLSDLDIQNGINRIAASSGSKQQIFASLNEVERSLKQNLFNTHKVLSRSGNVGPFPADLGAPAETTAPAAKPINEITTEDISKMSREEKQRLLDSLNE